MENQNTKIHFINDLLKELKNKNDFTILHQYKEISLLNNKQYISREDFMLICDILKMTKNKKYDDIINCLKEDVDFFDISSIDYRIYRKLKVKKAVKPDIEKFIKWAELEEEEDDCDKCDEMLDYEECNNPAYQSDGYKCKLHKRI